MFKRILVPTDGSDITAKAVKTAIGMARLSGAELFVLAVKEPFPYSAISEMQPVPPQEFFDAQERVAGELTARGSEGKGGDIRVLGERVALESAAKIDASGPAGGGQILVGGDYQGNNSSVQNARREI